MNDMMLITESITRVQLKQLAEQSFGDFVKAVVDIRRHSMVVGGELHADAEKMLLEHGSTQADLWGINLYPDAADQQLIEFDSMINIRPQANNRSRSVEDPVIQHTITALVHRLVQPA